MSKIGYGMVKVIDGPFRGLEGLYDDDEYIENEYGDDEHFAVIYFGTYMDGANYVDIDDIKELKKPVDPKHFCQRCNEFAFEND